jgi:hypothetical protein
MFPVVASTIGLLLSVPTQTAADTCGVKPTIQASLFWPVSPSWAVPVFDADCRPSASGRCDHAATCSIEYVVSLATCGLNARRSVGACW